jgi:hypothetical protein
MTVHAARTTATDDRDARLQVTSVLHALDRTDLAEINRVAARQERVDRKYVLDLTDLVPILGTLPAGIRTLQIGGHISTTYASRYLDTRDLRSFRDAATHRRRRAKIRMRRYESGASFLEIKTPGPRNVTRKVRRPHRFGERVDDDARDFLTTHLREEEVAVPRPEELVLDTTYDRSTLLLPGGDRATVDCGLVLADPRRGPDRGVAVVGQAIVETKSGRRPTLLDRELWRAGHRPVRISKFGAGLALTRGEHPRRWARAVGRLHTIDRTTTWENR